MEQLNEVIAELRELKRWKPTRRTLLQSSVGAMALASMGASAASPYRVGVGRSSDAYDGYNATSRALDASGEWSALNLSGKAVIIKPNLVGKALPQTGIVTDSEVVRAVVDRAFASGAIFIVMIEAGPTGANFDACGYGFFRTYDPNNRIRLVDLSTLPLGLVNVWGWIYDSIYTRPHVLSRDYIFINIAKMKTHAEALVTLGTKNLFGLPSITNYISNPPAGRFAMHDRGLPQAILDVFRLRKPDYTIIDGVVAMEGNGPAAGTPVAMNTVLAGRNTLAVDRVALAAMNIPGNAVRHINYVTAANLGPADLSQITVTGDSLEQVTFALPTIPPSIDAPVVSSAPFKPGGGSLLTIHNKYYDQCFRIVQIQLLSDENPTVEVVRTVAPVAFHSAGTEDMTWDGYTDGGTPATPGRYAVHVRAVRTDVHTRPADATSWVNVIA